MPRDKTLNAILVRHGETQANKEGKLADFLFSDTYSPHGKLESRATGNLID
jgi:broad specificity phosphatase PhoE